MLGKHACCMLVSMEKKNYFVLLTPVLSESFTSGVGSWRLSFSGVHWASGRLPPSRASWQQSPGWAVITLGSERLPSSVVLSNIPALQSFSELLYISLKKTDFNYEMTLDL